jgi:hypothetical protein
MKTRLYLLIAASFFIVTVSKAQYGASCTDNRLVVQSQVVIPGHTLVSVNYRSAPREQYYDYPEQRVAEYDRRDDHHDERRDWREEAYNHYCHENRGYRISREEFYRSHCDYRSVPYYAPRKVVVYGY